MPRERPSFSVIILAAQRQGAIDPLARDAGISHKCLVPIAGRPLIRHVVEAIAGIAGLSRIRISIEDDMAASVGAALAGIVGPAIDTVPASENLADSVHGAAQGLDGAIVVTTADNVLLTAASVEALLAALDGGADAAVALARRESVLLAHPDGQRRFYRLADDSYSNCNLYGISGQRGSAAIETFRSGGQFAKHPLRIARAFGIINLLLMRYALVSLPRAMARVSRRLGLRIEGVVLSDGSQAIDVDNRRTFGIVELLLERRCEQRPQPSHANDLRK